MKTIISNGSNCCEDFEFDDMCFEIGVAMQRISKLSHSKTAWAATVSNFGWRHLDGSKKFTINWDELENPEQMGRKLLQEVLPDTECYFKVSVDYRKRIIEINNAHHDAPMGGEIYVIKNQTGT